jgi:hypothetical protein
MSILNIAKCCDTDLQLMNVISSTVRHNDHHSVNDACNMAALPAALLQPMGRMHAHIFMCVFAFV